MLVLGGADVLSSKTELYGRRVLPSLVSLAGNEGWEKAMRWVDIVDTSVFVFVSEELSLTVYFVDR